MRDKASSHVAITHVMSSIFPALSMNILNSLDTANDQQALFACQRQTKPVASKKDAQSLRKMPRPLSGLLCRTLPISGMQAG